MYILVHGMDVEINPLRTKKIRYCLEDLHLWIIFMHDINVHVVV